jgi:hypothetical protein
MALRSRFQKGVAVASLGAMLLSACASPRDKYIVATDSCSSIREPYVQILERQQEQVAEWAAAGALTGAGAGAAIGAAADGSLAGVLIGLVGGAVAGAAAGAAMGYYANLEERGLQTGALRNAIMQDATQDVRTTDRLLVALQQLNACRLQAVQRVADDIQAGRIDKAEARARLNQIKANVASDNELVAEALDGLQERTGIYVDAMSRSGAENTDAYLASIEPYRPQIQAASYTVGRAPTAVTLNAQATVRAAPSTASKAMTSLRPGTRVEVIGQNDGWAQIDFGAEQGYVLAALVTSGPTSAQTTGTLSGIRLEEEARPQTTNSIQALAIRQAEVSAVGEAHVRSVNQSIADTEALLL